MTTASTWNQLMAEQDAVDAMRYELHQMMRCAFMAKYPTGKEFYFAHSLNTARWGDCQKDIQRGKLTHQRAGEIVADAIEHHILSRDFAELCGLPVE